MADKTIGERLRELRGRLYTQRELAERAEVSVDLVRKLEQGARNSASVASLHRLARALDVSLADLLGRGSMPDQDGGVTGLRHAVAGVDDLLGRSGEPWDGNEAERTLTYLWSAYWAGRYEQVVSVLPDALRSLRADADDAGSDERVARAYWLAGYVLVQLQQPDAAFLAVRKAIERADRSGDPLLAATLRGSLSWQLMVSGRYDEAETLALRSAGSVEPRGEVSGPSLSTYGSLLLSGATAAARGRKHGRARELLAESAQVAGRIGEDREDYQTAFGPSQVAMQSVDVNVQLGEFPDALAAARTMPGSGVALPMASRARHLTDRALAHTRLGQHDKAAMLVMTAEQWAPDWAKHQSLLKSVTRDLLHTRESRTPRLREMAGRIGAR